MNGMHLVRTSTPCLAAAADNADGNRAVGHLATTKDGGTKMTAIGQQPVRTVTTPVSAAVALILLR